MKNSISFCLTFIIMTLFINAQGQNRYLTEPQTDTVSVLTQHLTGLSILLRKWQNGQDSVKVADVGRVNNSLQSSMDKLINNCLSENTGKEVVRKIYKDLSNYNDLLTFAIHQKSIDSLDQIVRFIDDDLRLKFSPAFKEKTSNETDMVEVRIEVFDNVNNKLSGYQGFVKPQWTLNPDQVEAFNPTNNAVKKIMPGKKLFWIKKDNKLVDQRVVEIYLDSNQPVQFIVK